MAYILTCDSSFGCGQGDATELNRRETAALGDGMGRVWRAQLLRPGVGDGHLGLGLKRQGRKPARRSELRPQGRTRVRQQTD